MTEIRKIDCYPEALEETMTFRRLATALILLFAVVGGIGVVRAILLESRQLRRTPGEVDGLHFPSAPQHLAESIRFQTVSYENPAKIDRSEFIAFREYLSRVYPKSHAALTRETVEQYSLLFRWEGSDGSKPPAILTGHTDVVPAGNEGAPGWQFPPFEGRTENGVIWGRGAIDDKVNVIGILEAVEALLATGHRPRRTVYLAFGHDEELEGRGAAAMAAALHARGVRPAFVLDEGGLIVSGLLPGVAAPVAAVAIGEKGYMDVELSVAGAGGHSSTPPSRTAVGKLSRAIVRLEEAQSAPSLKGAARMTLDYAAPEMPFALKLVMANLWLTEPLVARMMAAEPAAAAQIRTTMAPTMLEGSPKSNLLPQRARAVVNVRLLPGETVRGVLEHIRRAVDDDGVEVRMLSGSEAPPLADPNSEAARLLQSSIRKVFPETIYAPVLSTGATDARHYARLTRNLFRFTPIRATGDTFSQMHGVNERIGADEFRQAVRFYAQLLKSL